MSRVKLPEYTSDEHWEDVKKLADQAESMKEAAFVRWQSVASERPLAKAENGEEARKWSAAWKARRTAAWWAYQAACAEYEHRCDQRLWWLKHVRNESTDPAAGIPGWTDGYRWIVEKFLNKP